MKILVCCRAIDNMAGGVERMATSLMNEMQKRGHEMSLLTWDHKDAVSFYPINEAIKWEKLNIGDPSRKATWKERYKRAIKARKIVRDIDPDVIIGFQDGPYMSMRAYTIGMGYPIVLAERNAPSRHLYKKSGRLRHLFFQTYRFAKKITVQCESYVNDYPTYLRSKIVTISNPVFPVQEDVTTPSKPTSDYDKKILLSVGRLSYQKNYPSLIGAFGLIADDFPDWKLVIIGEGEDREALEAEIKNLGLEKRIEMPGVKEDLGETYRSTTLFCLPSLWEGFPNALAEAFAHGIPAVGYAECAGVRDLIKNQETGILAPGNGDMKSLAEALKELMRDERARKEMGKAAAQSVKAYTPEKIYDLWENLFKGIVKT